MAIFSVSSPLSKRREVFYAKNTPVRLGGPPLLQRGDKYGGSR